jgi:uncharacterized Zn finger protein
MSSWFYNYLRNIQPGPLPAKAGIKAQSKRGAFGQNWWAKRWIATLEGFAMGPRLTRGKTYARNGQEISLAIDKGIVVGKVQGSRRTPYEVRIEVTKLTPEEWAKAAKALASHASFMASHLGGQMPSDVEKAFTASGLTLFPKSLLELRTSCSCPDWAVPCKHTAAVYYLIGEEFDRDPFLIFKLRGIGRDELIQLALRRDNEPDVDPRTKKAAKNQDKAQRAKAPAPGPIPTDPARFWANRTQHIRAEIDVSVPDSPAGLAKRLGYFPLWRGETDLIEALTPIHVDAMMPGMAVITGESDIRGASLSELFEKTKRFT